MHFNDLFPECSACVTDCTPADKGLNVEVKYFQLLKIDIPSDVEQRFVEALVLQETAEEEILKQEAIVVRKETSQQVCYYKKRNIWGICHGNHIISISIRNREMKKT